MGILLLRIFSHGGRGSCKTWFRWAVTFDLLVMMDRHFIGTCKEEAAVILMFLFEKEIGVFIVEDNRLYLPKQMDLASFVIKSVSELNVDGQQEESHD